MLLRCVDASEAKKILRKFKKELVEAVQVDIWRRNKSWEPDITCGQWKAIISRVVKRVSLSDFGLALTGFELNDLG